MKIRKMVHVIGATLLVGVVFAAPPAKKNFDMVGLWEFDELCAQAYEIPGSSGDPTIVYGEGVLDTITERADGRVHHDAL